MCNGVTALCPTSEPKENFTSCNKETQVCLGGVRSKQHRARVALFTLCCFMWALIQHCCEQPRTQPSHISWNFPTVVSCTVNYTVYLNWKPFHWTRSALARFVRSITWRFALAPAKMARTRLPNCATCAVWKKVSEHLIVLIPKHEVTVTRKNRRPGLWLILMIFLPLPSVQPSTCSSSGSDKWKKFFNNKVTTLQPGSPCNDFKGYCDVFMRCRLVDADGPLARLKKAIFNPELYENIAEWIVVSGETGSVASPSVGGKRTDQLLLSQSIDYYLYSAKSHPIDAWRSLNLPAVWRSSSWWWNFTCMLLIVISCSPGSLVGSVADGHRSHHAHGWLHKDLQCAHTQQQPQTAATQATARYSAPCLCWTDVFNYVFCKILLWWGKSFRTHYVYLM